MKTIEEFKGSAEGLPAYIVGKGPSLAFLTAKDIPPEAVVITINHAIDVVKGLGLPNRIISMRKDGCRAGEKSVGHECKEKFELTLGIPLLTQNLSIDGKYCFKEHDPHYFNSKLDFGVETNIPSSPTAAGFAVYMGCTSVHFMCCDSYVNGDSHMYGGTYASSNYVLQKKMAIDILVKRGVLKYSFNLPKGYKRVKDDRKKIMIATPMYPDSGHSKYISSLVNNLLILQKHTNFEFVFAEQTGNCYIERARNELTNYFMCSDCTHLFFIDSDIEFDLEAISRVIAADKEICGCTYRRKNDWESFCGTIETNDDRTPKVVNGLIKANSLPAGFMLISRSALEKISKTCDATSYNEKMYVDFFGLIKQDGVTYGEDYSFCIRAKRAGVQSWLEPRGTLTHYGTIGYKGNFHNFMLNQPRPN